MGTLRFNYSELTDVGLVRKANEDCMGNALTPSGHIFTVCDGMGGHVGGATASKLAVQSILEYFSREKYDNIAIAIGDSIHFANEQIYAHAQNNSALKGMGTTCTIAVVTEKEIYIGHVGDSRIYIRTAGKLRRITRDHSFVQTLVSRGIISDYDAEQHPRKNELLMALGIKPEVQPTVSTLPLKPCTGDVLMLCSDGLCGLVNDMTMDSIIIRASDLVNAANDLIIAAKNAGGHDNISVQLIQFTESPYAVAEFEDCSPEELRDTKNLGFDATKTDHHLLETTKKGGDGRKKWTILVGIALLAMLFFMGFLLTTDDQAPPINSDKSKDGIFTIKDSSAITLDSCRKLLPIGVDLSIKLLDSNDVWLSPGAKGYPKDTDTLKAGTQLRLIMKGDTKKDNTTKETNDSIHLSAPNASQK